MSHLFAILSLIILIIIPTLIYAFIYALKCPQNIFRRSTDENSGPAASKTGITQHMDTVLNLKYKKELTSLDEPGNECPVCLTAFVEGEEVRQLKTCKHIYHVVCIDKWLCSHSNCPVCRASVPVKRPRRPPVIIDDDFRQGLPDAASLI
uniref:RING-H2 finger protein ATL33-like n=1 Tax=Nicotiana sylvestris TaxID=4096 RepID=A0A1U7XGB6_NICSY|nr:PREDICTED: RING-H2 finger protein ATL33-like [Nicotiana sylvestris]